MASLQADNDTDRAAARADCGSSLPPEAAGRPQQAVRRNVHHGGLVWLALFVVIALMLVQLPPLIARQDAVTQAYSALVEVDALARQKFVERVESGRLVDGAIRGMLLQLDPYSGYVSPTELPAFERRQRGTFSGVGVELGIRNGRLSVIAPIEGSPAEAAGILPGDWLLAVDGRDVRDHSVFEVEEMLIGLPGTDVELRIQHNDGEFAETLTLRRAPIVLTSVRGIRRDAAGDQDFLLDRQSRIGYIRVSTFHERTIHEFDSALRTLNRQGARALILDLRFNPGGQMDQAVEMVNRFVDHGTLLRTVNRHRSVEEYRARPRQMTWREPVVVLINGGSASSAEIVAGSLQALERAVVVGERSFGKGSVQHLIPLSGHKAAVKLTVAYYRLPDGRVIHRTDANARSDSWGVIPDMLVELTDYEEEQLQQMRREFDAATPATGRAGQATSNALAEWLSVDAQLMAALTVAGKELTR